jgi:hypothetical protein
MTPASTVLLALAVSALVILLAGTTLPGFLGGVTPVQPAQKR